MELAIQCKTFATLTPNELYAIMRLRSEVFVVEQNCPYLDADNKDLKCHHLMFFDGEHLAAYARLVPLNISYENMVSIGRVVTGSNYRKGGYGKLLMQTAIEKCDELFGHINIKIGAQLYLKKFYESFGFIQTSDVYDEDGIDHIEMELKS